MGLGGSKPVNSLRKKNQKSTTERQMASILYQVDNQQVLAENDHVRVMKVRDVDALNAGVRKTQT